MTEIEPDAFHHKGITVYRNEDIDYQKTLYTAETIRKKIEKLRDKGIDAQGNCENIARDKALRELKEVFSE